jgi:hypothetical protein
MTNLALGKITLLAIVCTAPLLCLTLGQAAERTRDNPSARHVFTAPAGTLYCQIHPTGTTVIPNGRLLTPRGRQILVEPHPYGMTLSQDGRTLITVYSGTEPFSFSIIHNPLSENPLLAAIPEGAKTDEGILNTCFMGLAIPAGFR